VGGAASGEVASAAADAVGAAAGGAALTGADGTQTGRQKDDPRRGWKQQRKLQREQQLQRELTAGKQQQMDFEVIKRHFATEVDGAAADGGVAAAQGTASEVCRAASTAAATQCAAHSQPQTTDDAAEGLTMGAAASAAVNDTPGVEAGGGQKGAKARRGAGPTGRKAKGSQQARPTGNTRDVRKRG